MTSKLAIWTTAAGLIGGSVVGATTFAPTLVGAQSDEEASTEDSTASSVETERSERLRDLLDDLVETGTLTDAQADAVAEHLAANIVRQGHRQGHRHGLAGARLTTVADIIGIDADALLEARRGGDTLAGVAEANGVSTEELVAALVNAVESRLADAVADGTITQEQADEKLADVEERITAAVNREGPIGPRGLGRRFGPWSPGFGGTDQS